MKRMTRTDVHRYVKTAAEIILIILLAWAAVRIYLSLGFSEAGAEGFYDDSITVGYVMCSRGDYVNVRPHPNRKGDPLGRLETGDTVYLDGVRKNGFLHCVDLGFEEMEGWIFAGYVVYDEPISMYSTATIVSRGRLAARKYVNGKRTRWLRSQATLRVYYWSDEWCVTDCGYVQTMFLELEGE